MLIDLRPKGLDGASVEHICNSVNITVNKNSVPGDKSALSPGGLRLGTPALTSRNFKNAEFVKVVELIDEACNIALEVRAKNGTKFGDFKKACLEDADVVAKIGSLQAKVNEFALQYPMPGFTDH